MRYLSTPCADARADIYRLSRKIAAVKAQQVVCDVAWLFKGLRLLGLYIQLSDAKVREELYRVTPEDVQRFRENR